MSCLHNKNHDAVVKVNFMEDTREFIAELSIKCADCGCAFQFIGLSLGLNMRGATMGVDGQVANLAMAPVGWEPHPLKALAFGVKKQ